MEPKNSQLDLRPSLHGFESQVESEGQYCIALASSVLRGLVSTIDD
jgi:hypothetical protein